MFRRWPRARIKLAGDMSLRLLTADDSVALARTVRESLEHLRPWMPWAADDESADPAFQHRRLTGLVHAAAEHREWQYGLFRAHDPRVVGAFGLMTRRGPGIIEIGYFIHADETGRGYATQSVAALTDVARRIPRTREVLICCDEANVRSAAIPRRLGYELARIDERMPEAPAETNRTLVFLLPAK